MPTNRLAIKISIVRPEGAAAAAGILPGDYLLEVGGYPTTSPESLSMALAGLQPGTPALIVRNEKRATITLNPGKLDISFGVEEITDPEGEAGPALSPAEEEADRQRRLAEIIITTAPTVDGYRVTHQLGIVTAECVFGMNLFRDFFAAVRDVFGGRSDATQKVLRDARETCLRELKEEALSRGANAVIAVNLDYSEFSGDGKSMLFLVASGTAVKIENS